MVYTNAILQLSLCVRCRLGRERAVGAKRMLDDGLCHVFAVEAHEGEDQIPCLPDSRHAAAQQLRAEETAHCALNTRRIIGIRTVGLNERQSHARAALRAEVPSPWRAAARRVRRGG